MRLASLLAAALLVLTSPAARADYLNTPGALAGAWAALLPTIPDDADLMHIEIAPDEIIVFLQNGVGKGGLAQITVSPVATPQGTDHRIAGPTPASDMFSQSFRLTDVARMEGIDAMRGTALAALKLGAEAQVTVIVVGYLSQDDGSPGPLAVIVEIESPPYLGSVEFTPEGQVRNVHLMHFGQAAPTLPLPAPTPAAPVPAPVPAPVAAAAFRGDSGTDLVAGLARFVEALGPETRVYEVDARPDRITVDRPHPTQPGTVAILTLTAQGFRDERTFPAMMQTEADLFPLSALSSLTPEVIDAARAAGLAAVGIPGGQLERLRVWSGAPFWRHPAGEPFFDIRVGVPPNGQPNGYGVVTLGGQVVEAFR